MQADRDSAVWGEICIKRPESVTNTDFVQLLLYEICDSLFTKQNPEKKIKAGVFGPCNVRIKPIKQLLTDV